MTVDTMWPAGLLPTGDEAQKVGRCSRLGALPAWLGLVLFGIAACVGAKMLRKWQLQGR
jgi:hypothetical protein